MNYYIYNKYIQGLHASHFLFDSRQVINCMIVVMNKSKQYRAKKRAN